MKQMGVSVLALLVALGAIGLHFFQRPPKIGYAETAVLMAEFTEAIHARKEFEEAQKEWDKNLKTINDSLLVAVNAMKANYEKSTPTVRHSMNDNLERWNATLERYAQAVKKMSQEKEKVLMGPVINKLNSFMKVWGQQNHYAMIFGTTDGGGILQANDAFNVTASLLEALNNHYKNLPVEAPKVDSTSPVPFKLKDSTSTKATHPGK